MVKNNFIEGGGVEESIKIAPEGRGQLLFTITQKMHSEMQLSVRELHSTVTAKFICCRLLSWTSAPSPHPYDALKQMGTEHPNP